ncbi:MAG: nucleotidyl transferase AbiEii/AbiGii toxin family protein, partial [Phycisphaerales bacterium]|nr:nucleotidyl transferase AbiEii/AbiGii toxin family protein [Phycisphaerales bacterium]
FDIWILASTRSFDGSLLQEAIRNTCDQRQAEIVSNPVAFQEGSIEDPAKQTQWAAFRRRLGGTEAPDSFPEVASAVVAFLGPVVEALASERRFGRHWRPGGPWS